eukprot:Skav214676  [mRNA]  locus=scaffold923:547076:548164:+ [translate_table: standard]
MAKTAQQKAAAKQVKKEEKAAKAAAKKAAKAAAKAKAQASQPSEPVDCERMVSRQDMSSMVTALKYKGQNAKDPQQTKAQQLLSHYHTLSDADKQSLVKKYQDQGGIRNLAWAASYIESSGSTQIAASGWQHGYYNVSEIFKLNGWDYIQVPEDQRDGMLQAFLEESALHISPTDEMPAVKDHAIPLLKKYLYCYKPEKIEHRNEDIYKQEFKGSLDGMNMDKVDKALGNAGEAQVKVEHPAFVAMCAEMKVIQTAKVKLEREINGCQSLLKDLKCAAVSACKTAEDQMTSGLQEIESWMDKLRSTAHQASLLVADGDPDDHKKMKTSLEALKSEAIVHQDGLKAVKNRLTMLLKEFVPKTG